MKNVLALLCSLVTYSFSGNVQSQVFSGMNFRLYSPAAKGGMPIMDPGRAGRDSVEAETVSFYKMEEEKLTCRNLRLYPVVATDEFAENNKEKAQYITLKEALKDNKAVVAENGSVQRLTYNDPGEASDDEENSDGIGQSSNADAYSYTSGATVNSLMINNTSEDTLFVMAGEVVTGGKQDRVIAQDMTIPPKTTSDIPVFCVEQSRWSGKSGEFDGYFAVSQLELRKVVTEEKQQSKVWEKVGEITEENDSETGTHTYAAIGNSKSLADSIKSYCDFFQDLPSRYPNAVGVIVVTGDKVVGCDMFANSTLFLEQYPALLQSYAMEAVNNGKPATAGYAEVSDYFQKLISEEEDKSKNGAEEAGKVHLYKYD